MAEMPITSHVVEVAEVREGVIKTMIIETIINIKMMKNQIGVITEEAEVVEDEAVVKLAKMAINTQNTTNKEVKMIKMMLINNKKRKM